MAHELMLPDSSWCCGAQNICELLLQGALLSLCYPGVVSYLLQVSLMDDQGNTKDDLGLPKGTDDAEKLAAQIKKDFDDGKELQVTVLKVRSRQPQTWCRLPVAAQGPGADHRAFHESCFSKCAHESPALRGSVTTWPPAALRSSRAARCGSASPSRLGVCACLDSLILLQQQTGCAAAAVKN